MSTNLLLVLCNTFIVYTYDLLSAGAYDNPTNQIDLLNSSQDSNPTQPLNQPSHVRREKT